MTFDTLRGRLQRLKTLAEIVAADDYATTLREILGELENELEGGLEPFSSGSAREVDPALLGSLHRRLVKAGRPGGA